MSDIHGINNDKNVDEVEFLCWGKNDKGQIDIQSFTNNYQLKIISTGSNFTCVASLNKIYCIGGGFTIKETDTSFDLEINPSIQTHNDRSNSNINSSQSTSTINENKHYPLINNNDEDDFNAAGSPFPSTSPLTNLPLNPSLTPPKIGEQIGSLYSGGQHACVLGRKLTVKCWGDNSYGQTDIIQNSNTNTNIYFKSQMLFISLGLQHSCGLNQDLILLCWGSDQYKQWDVVR